MCSEPLLHRGRVLQCSGGHAFDVARAGYVNLSLGRAIGDSKEMLAARRRFLDRGHYAPIADRLLDVVAASLDHPGLSTSPSPVILDVGCGEGYYLSRLAGGLDARRPTPCRYAGLDGSKDAIRLAVKRLPGLCAIVADVWRAVPVRNAACDALLNLFAPRNPAEFARILRPGGLLTIVIPAPGHLESLRSLVPLIGVEERKTANLLDDLARHSFRHTNSDELSFDVRLHSDDIVDLITMSPSFRHLQPGDLDRVRVMEALTTEVRVLALAFTRE